MGWLPEGSKRLLAKEADRTIWHSSLDTAFIEFDEAWNIYFVLSYVWFVKAG